MLLWTPLADTQPSPVAPRSWVLLSGHTQGKRHDQRAKPGEGLRCCVCLHTRYACSLPLLFPSPLCPSLSFRFPVYSYLPFYLSSSYSILSPLILSSPSPHD
ncbi:unnamed protein product [Schistocephalus solidus]|uniref:Secreted protein n=1 Tax=Schistocephalus solidus TaxID=70667 RepID=A0A183T4S7_SCHSO|nr:unnamed protein product [Schistocephalus solidus]